MSDSEQDDYPTTKPQRRSTYILEDDDDDDSESDDSSEFPGNDAAKEEDSSDEDSGSDSESESDPDREIDLAANAGEDYHEKEERMSRKERRAMEKFIDSSSSPSDREFGTDQFRKDMCDSEAEEEMAVQEFLEQLERNKEREQKREQRLRRLGNRDQMCLFDMFSSTTRRKPRMVCPPSAAASSSTTTAKKKAPYFLAKRKVVWTPVDENRCVITKKQRLLCAKNGCGNYRELSQWLCQTCTDEKRQKLARGKRRGRSRQTKA